MKKILIFSLAYYPRFVSGAEAAIKEITDRINPPDIEFHLITLLFDTASPRRERIGNVEVHRVGFGGSYISKVFFIPLAVLKARALHGKIHFDALWSVMTYMLFPVVIAKMIGVQVPHILTLQDGDPYEKVFGRMRIMPFLPFLNWGFKRAAIVQVISTYLASWPKKRGYEGEVVIIPNGFDPENADVDKVESLKETLGKKEGDVWLVNTSRLVYQKGNDVIIRALPLLPPHVKFLVVGGGPDEKMLKDLAERLEVESRIMFVGLVPRSEAGAYRRAADIFVCPSRSEGFGIVFVSAMAEGLPVIATQEGGIADYLYDERKDPDKPTTGWAVDRDNPKQIAEAVYEIISNPEKVRRVVENARAMAWERYSWDHIAEEMKTKVFDRRL